MYAQKMAAAIKVHGKTLRELNENVFLPIGSEYSIFLKNLNTVRASVKIEIDGQDVTEGVSLVIDPNESYEIERFIKNGNLQNGNRFKFIEQTAQVVKHRGSRIDDGIIRITYQFEAVQNRIFRKQPEILLGSSQSSVNSSSTVAGITAPGSISSQEFRAVSPLSLESTRHVIIMRLVGELNGKDVLDPIVTRSVTTCVTCGSKTKNATAKFCSQCGTSLQLIN